MTRSRLVSTLALAALLSGVSPTALADSVKLQTDDGKAVFGEHVGQGEKGVVLVHDAERSASDWDSFAKRLSSNGFQVIALDLRGHGASKAAAAELHAEDWLAMDADVKAAVAWLHARGSTRVSVVGSALGANVAARAAARDETIERVVLLSPGLNLHGVTVATALSELDRPALIVADDKNPASARAATLLAEQSASVDVELVPAGSAGHRMLNTVPELEGRLVGWLNGASTGNGQELAKPTRTLGAGEPESIETTGTSFGEPR